MNRQRDVRTAIAEIIEDCSVREFEALSLREYFDIQHPQIAREFSSDITRIKQSGAKWGEFLREIRFWHTVGVEQMSRRVLQLSLQYMTKDQQFFNFKNEIGSFTIPTRIDRLNKISLLANKLLFDIFPRIEGQLNFETGSEIKQAKTVRGTINWNKTILDSACHGQKFPLQFSCIVERTHFGTPENLLALYSILRLQYDLGSILFFKDNPGEDLSCKEIRLLKNLKNQVDNTVFHTKLRELIPKIERYKSHNLGSQFVEKRENQTCERIRRGIVKQKSYTDLVEWLRKYRGYNIRSLSMKFTNFPASHKKSFDTMYELWIIFEIMAYLQKKGMQFITTLEHNNEFAGFKIRSGDVVFKLNYQGRYTGWTERTSNPDFTIQIGDTNNIPIIMDPKNWAKPQYGEAVHKMLGYMMNLYEFDTHIGILFFSHAKRHKGPQPSPYVEKSHKIQGKNFILSIIHVKPADTNVERSLEKVYQYILAVCHKTNPPINPSN